MATLHITPEFDRRWHKLDSDCWCAPKAHQYCPECKRGDVGCPVCDDYRLLPIEYVDEGITVIYVHNKNGDPKEFYGRWRLTEE
jgi:hypothetical protein